jgi:FixJ family two-component response regulator
MGRRHVCGYAESSKPEAAMSEPPLVAIVDDDYSIRAGIQDLFRAAGFRASTFDSAESFLDSPLCEAASCLVTDMRMGGMSGLDLYHRIVTTGRVIPTVLITAHPREVTELRARQAGIRCYLTKPFTPDELLECVRAALSKRQAPGYP